MAMWRLFRSSGLSQFVIGDLIAQGGMSKVYKAKRAKSGETVAIKLVTPEFSELADQLDRILAKSSEGAIALGLIHENVVRTYEFGKKGKQYYIVMEFVNGPNLQRLINSKDPMWRGNRFRMGLDIARGLGYIHQNNLVHRDFCPKNILLDQGGTPKIIDFGLALPADVTNRWRFDRSGTASYMAPEQVRGREVDFRSDIYAFGMTLYEVLTGKRPYPKAKSRQEKMTGHLNIEPVPPRHYCKEIPIPLEHVILRCIAKRPEDRYPAMDGVIQEMCQVYRLFVNGQRRKGLPANSLPAKSHVSRRPALAAGLAGMRGAD